MEDDPSERKRPKGSPAASTTEKSPSISITALFAQASARQKRIVAAASESRGHAFTTCSDAGAVDIVSICEETDVVVDLSLSQDDPPNDGQSLASKNGESGGGSNKLSVPHSGQTDVGKSQLASGGTTRSRSSDKWACSACTFLNSDLANKKAQWRRRRCQVCGALREDPGQPSPCSPPPAKTNSGEHSLVSQTQQQASATEPTFEDDSESATPIYVQWGAVMQSRRAKTYADLGHRVSYQRTISATMAKNPKSAAGKFVAFFVRNSKTSRSDSGSCGGSSADQQQSNLSKLADGLLLRRIVQSWMLEQTPRPFVRSNYRSALGERYQPGCGTGKHDRLRQSSSSRWLPPQSQVTQPSSAQDVSAVSAAPSKQLRAHSRLETMESNMRFILQAVSCNQCDMFEAGSVDALVFLKICQMFGLVPSHQQGRGAQHAATHASLDFEPDAFARSLIVMLFYTHGKRWNRLARHFHDWPSLQIAARGLVHARTGHPANSLNLNLLSGEVAKILQASKESGASSGCTSFLSMVSFSSTVTPANGLGEPFGMLSVSDAIAASDAVEFPVRRTGTGQLKSSGSRGNKKLRRFWLVLDILHNHVDTKLVAQWVKQHCRTPRLKKPKPVSSAAHAGSNPRSRQEKSPPSVTRTGSFNGRMSTKTACAVDFIEAMVREAEVAQTLPPGTSKNVGRKRTVRSPSKPQLMTGPNKTFQKFLERSVCVVE